MLLTMLNKQFIVKKGFSECKKVGYRFWFSRVLISILTVKMPHNVSKYVKETISCEKRFFGIRKSCI